MHTMQRAWVPSQPPPNTYDLAILHQHRISIPKIRHTISSNHELLMITISRDFDTFTQLSACCPSLHDIIQHARFLARLNQRSTLSPSESYLRIQKNNRTCSIMTFLPSTVISTSARLIAAALKLRAASVLLAARKDALALRARPWRIIPRNGSQICVQAGRKAGGWEGAV